MTASNISPDQTRPLLREQLRTYDNCFGEFLAPAFNGEKHLQSILMRETFQRFAKQKVGIRQDAPTIILDVSCGPGEYSAAWTSQISRFLPLGMEFHCTDYKGGRCEDGTPYPLATTKAIKAAAEKGNINLAGGPTGLEADLFSGEEPIILSGKAADIVHWSHSGYYVREALGEQKDDPAAVRQGLNQAADKIWAALAEDGLLFSIHDIQDTTDGIPCDMYFENKLGNVPQHIERRVKELGGYVTNVNFATPLRFPVMQDHQWDALKNPAGWDYLDAGQARSLLLLQFMLHDFSDPHKAGLVTLAEKGELAAFIDAYKNVTRKNGGHVSVKCAFQMVCKSQQIGRKLSGIAAELKQNMPEYLAEMAREMAKAEGQN